MSQEPARCCDLVMKGGLTSGIVYPPAICRIAEKFHLVGIGGTSAGAIAACIAAAAEYRRRQTGSDDGYRRLERVPGELSGEGQLRALFRPDGPTRDLFELALQLQQGSKLGWWKRARLKAKLLRKALAHEKTLRPLVDNGFGLCTGMANDNRPKEGEIPPLTEWLADVVDKVAGLSGEILTFGHLWQAKLPPSPLAEALEGLERSIDFRAITTCLTFGRPYQLPFATGIFAFDPDEWRRLFPGRVVDHLVRVAEAKPSKTLTRDGKLPLPVGADMPVVVAARMSLSFPLLFAMVPLYAVDFESPPAPDGSYPLRKVWFSDGGITSNLPIDCFDALFPSWPTLAINLQYVEKGGKPARKAADPSLLYMIGRLQDGANDLWHVFDRSKSALSDFAGFAGAIFRSAQVWHDTSFLRLPGFRDRWIEIWLTSEEGGNNLEMPTGVIQDLIARGDEAGKRLRDRFATAAGPQQLSWETHRWARLRTSLAGLAHALQRVEHNLSHPMPGDRPITDLFADPAGPPAYPFATKKQLAAARQALDTLLAWARSVRPTGTEPSDYPFNDGPRPPIQVAGRAPM